VLHHHSGTASTVTLSQTVAPMTVGEEFFVHGDAGRIVLLPDGERPPISPYQRAVDDLLAAATTGGSHELDVHFGRDVVVVLEAALRALASGCRESVGS
jgi:hypothetical protein